MVLSLWRALNNTVPNHSFSLWLPTSACQTQQASWGKRNPWMLSAEVSILRHRVGRRGWI